MRSGVCFCIFSWQEILRGGGLLQSIFEKVLSRLKLTSVKRRSGNWACDLYLWEWGTDDGASLIFPPFPHATGAKTHGEDHGGLKTGGGGFLLK